MSKQQMKYMVERSKDGQFYVNIVRGGRVLFTSETYYNKRAGAVKVARSMGGDEKTIVDNTVSEKSVSSKSKSKVSSKKMRAAKESAGVGKKTPTASPSKSKGFSVANTVKAAKTAKTVVDSKETKKKGGN